MHGKGAHYHKNKSGQYEGFEGYFEKDICLQEQRIEDYM